MQEQISRVTSSLDTSFEAKGLRDFKRTILTSTAGTMLTARSTFSLDGTTPRQEILDVGLVLKEFLLRPEPMPSRDVDCYSEARDSLVNSSCPLSLVNR